MVFSKVGAALLLAMAVDFGGLLAHAFFEGRREVFVLDLVEGRVVERQRARLGERVRSRPAARPAAANWRSGGGGD
jgi:hypothetical protein